MAVSTLNEPIRILDTLEQTHPDLILLDVIMPGLSGYDICRMLRASERWSSMPIVFLTSKSDAQGRTAAFQAGADDFLAKPIISDELLLRVKLQLQRARNERDRGGTDQITGLFSQEAFLSRGEELLSSARAKIENLSLAVIQIADFDELDAYGMFAKINVVATLGKLIQARFPAETLRGRLGESGFMLAFRSESARTATEAMAFLVDELEQINFIGEQGRSYTAGARVAAAECPQDGSSLDSLVQTASRRLLTPSAS
jgi:PleD family two-component response regulator